MIEGRCECGAVHYEVDGNITDFSHCHCAMCRRLHGAPYVSFGGVDEAQFKWASGEDRLKIYASSAKNDRYFCSDCGSQLQVRSKEEPGVIYLAMGTVSGDPELPDGYHAYVDSKAPWVDINDDLPQSPAD